MPLVVGGILGWDAWGGDALAGSASVWYVGVIICRWGEGSSCG